MHQHGPMCLEGPVSRKRSWWLTAAAVDTGHDETSPLPGGTSPSAGAPFRLDLIQRVRREIAEGTYDTPDKWEKALDRLLDDLERQ